MAAPERNEGADAEHPSVVIALMTPMLRIAVGRILAESGLTAIDEPGEGVALWRALRRARPDLLIVGEDIDHAALRRLRGASAATRVVLLARGPSDLYGRLVVGAGASCVDEGASRRQILAALHATARGENVFVSARAGERRLAAARALLSRRERDVLAMLVEEHSYDEIALALSIELETVKTHVKRIYRKLGVHSRTELRGRVLGESAAPGGREHHSPGTAEPESVYGTATRDGTPR